MANRFEMAKKYTEKYKQILLPCQFCGNEDVRIVSDRSVFGSRNLWGVCCQTPKCDCTGSYISVKDAVKRWNEMQGERIVEYEGKR